MKQAIIFDFFGVICSEVIPIWSKQYFSEEERERIQNEYIREADRGVISEDELSEKIARLVNKPAATIRTEWQEYIKIDKDVVEMIRKLKTKYKIGLCTNAFSTFLVPILDKFELRGLFDAMVISDEIGHVKPEREMFTAILTRLGVSAENAILIDDQGRNIEGAKHVGIEGVLYNSIDQLKILL